MGAGERRRVARGYHHEIPLPLLSIATFQEGARWEEKILKVFFIFILTNFPPCPKINMVRKMNPSQRNKKYRKPRCVTFLVMGSYTRGFLFFLGG
jgi:hypothetical protein